MTYDPDFDISTSERWWELMSQVLKYNLVVHIAKIKEDGNIIYEDRGLEEDTAVYFRTARFIKENFKALKEVLEVEEELWKETL